ncbi:MAG: porin family protein [Sebaldella sp.]|nr:porin family protein [Sebaldella sp.]
MKKLALSLAVILGTISFADSFELRTGYDIGGSYSNGPDADGLPFEIGVEYRKSLPYGFELGAGLAYQWHESTDNGDMYNSVPIYATARYNFGTFNGFTPYLKGDVGYSFNMGDYNYNSGSYYGRSSVDGDIDNGFYYGVGGGVEYRGLTIDLMYKQNFADYTVKYSGPGYYVEDSGNADYSRVTLNIGYNFHVDY